MTKRPYLVVHDYGMGGIWMYIDAASGEEIKRVYPELTVFERPPDFLTEQQLASIDQELHFDLEAAPTGYLADLVTGRDGP